MFAERTLLSLALWTEKLDHVKAVLIVENIMNNESPVVHLSGCTSQFSM